jgi:hypothetical protein
MSASAWLSSLCSAPARAAKRNSYAGRVAPPIVNFLVRPCIACWVCAARICSFTSVSAIPGTSTGTAGRFGYVLRSGSWKSEPPLDGSPDGPSSCREASSASLGAAFATAGGISAAPAPASPAPMNPRRPMRKPSSPPAPFSVGSLMPTGI